MDNDLKCNRLTCRRTLSDKAVVTTCSHIFCVECANELFNAARLCPACETSLTEPDDVVVSSLHPTNDYKTSVLSGLTPSTVLDICSRAIAFWQYQSQQELSFQIAVVRNLNDKNAQFQKQLDNVIREANNEIALLNNKMSELERDLELERRKLRETQEMSRERDKEYQKLKAHFDKAKRKALLAPGTSNGAQGSSHAQNTTSDLNLHVQAKSSSRNFTAGAGMDLGALVGGMEANGIQRTPIINRSLDGGYGGGTFIPQQSLTSSWQLQQQNLQHQQQQQGASHRHKTRGPKIRHRHTISDASDSANEVENHLFGGGGAGARVRSHMMSEGGPRVRSHMPEGGAMGRMANTAKATPQVFAPPIQRKHGGGFRPAVGR